MWFGIPFPKISFLQLETDHFFRICFKQEFYDFRCRCRFFTFLSFFGQPTKFLWGIAQWKVNINNYVILSILISEGQTAWISLNIIRNKERSTRDYSFKTWRLNPFNLDKLDRLETKIAERNDVPLLNCLWPLNIHSFYIDF